MVILVLEYFLSLELNGSLPRINPRSTAEHLMTYTIWLSSILDIYRFLKKSAYKIFSHHNEKVQKKNKFSYTSLV